MDLKPILIKEQTVGMCMSITKLGLKPAKGEKPTAEDFFIGSASKKTTRSVLSSVILSPDEILSFRKGSEFAVNIAGIADHSIGEILYQNLKDPLRRQLAPEGGGSFDLVDNAQKEGLMGGDRKLTIPDDVFLMTVVKKMVELSTEELKKISESKRPSLHTVITRWGSDENDWD